MGKIENRWRLSVSRREAPASLAGVLAASPLLKAQLDPHSLIGHKRVPALDELVDAFDFEAVCYKNLPLETYDYTAHGDGSEWNLRRNRQVFDWVDVVPGKAVDPKTVDLSSELLGVKMAFPIFSAPSSGHGALHPEGRSRPIAGAQRRLTRCAVSQAARPSRIRRSRRHRRDRDGRSSIRSPIWGPPSNRCRCSRISEPGLSSSPWINKPPFTSAIFTTVTSAA
jgi:hypothetical protein